MKVKTVKPKTFDPKLRRKLWAWFIVTLVVVTLLQVFVHPHPYFNIDGAFLFYPLYGLVTSMLLVLVSKFLGAALKRNEDYWGEK